VLSAEVVNLGVGGATLQRQLAEAVPDTACNLVTVSYGANDWNVHVPLTEFRENARALVAALRRRFPQAPLVLTTPVPFFRATAPNKGGATLDDFRHALEDVGQEQNVPVIRGTDLVPADHYYFNDWSHPNDQGMQRIAENLLAHLRALGLRDRA